MEQHRRQVQMERIREEERKRSQASSKAMNGASKGGNRGGLDSKASVNPQGQLVWD